VCHAARSLSEKGHKPDGIVLEAAILNARKAFKEFILMPVVCRLSQKIPNLIDKILHTTGIHFENDKQYFFLAS
jgi:hypothetical protein